MKAVEYIYQETKIHFLLGRGGEQVMVNATEMAKIYERETRLFLKSDQTQRFIQAIIRAPYGAPIGQVNNKSTTENANRAPNGAHLEADVPESVIQRRGRNGIFFCDILALEFASWLDPDFKVWVWYTINEVLFGHYRVMDKKLRDRAKRELEIQKLKLKFEQDPEFQRLQRLQQEERSNKYSISQELKNQTRLFMDEHVGAGREE